MKKRTCVFLAPPLVASTVACATAGSTWIAEPLREQDDDYEPSVWAPEEPSGRLPSQRYQVRTIGGAVEPQEVRERRIEGERLQGRILGKFRNTYYDFPAETEFKGEKVSVRNAACEVIREVPRPFYEALCVQGSGLLESGHTVSFAKRDCECAEVCPRTQQKICFDMLDAAGYPWGRGALGKPITPLLTVAVDSSVIPMETAIYIPEYDGIPRDAASSSFHDGCFVAQDRGTKVVGNHVDVFTGQSTVTSLWNRLVPSNKGVTVVLDSPRCARAIVSSSR